jgi:cell division GTPase FtsZ
VGLGFVAVGSLDRVTMLQISRRLAICYTAHRSRHAGTGGNPELGEKAAQESCADLAEVVGGADMVRIYGLLCVKVLSTAGSPHHLCEH